MKQKCGFTGKRKFEDYEEALDRLIFLKNFQPRDPLTGKRVKHRQKRPKLKRAYKCHHCHGYHLTSSERNYNCKEESAGVKLQISKQLLLLWRSHLGPAPVNARARRQKRRSSRFARFANSTKR